SSLSIYAPATSTIYTLSLHDALPISLDNLMKFTDMFLSTIRGTDSYQALYNHMHFFDHSLKNLSYALQYDDYHIKANKNFQKTEITIRTDVLDTLADALRAIPCQILLSARWKFTAS